jgi:serine protease Do
MWQMGKHWAQARRGAIIGLGTLLVVGGLGVALGSGKLNATLPPASGDTASSAVAAAPNGAPSFADLVERVGPSVVNIKVTKVEKMTGPDMMGPEGFGPDSPFGDFMQKFFGGQMPQTPRERKAQGAGSGFIISKDGYIVTNNHVVEDATEVTVTLANKTEYKAKVIGRDPKTDVAVVKIEPKETLTVASLGNSEVLRVGDWVMAVGNPFGLSNSVTAGIVSAKNRVIGAGPYDDFIQTDAPINPGNSGGPLFNLQGEVVGINTAIVPNGQGIGFAVAVNTAKALLPQLETKGEVTRGYLGVNVQGLTPELAKSMRLRETKGALVAGVSKGSPADAAGIKPGDVIVSFDGKDVPDVSHLPMLVAATAVDKTVPVKILRDGSEQTVNVQVARMPGEKAASKPETGQAEPAQSKWGMALRDLDARTAQRVGIPSGEGVLVTGVKPDSPADRAGLQTGDVILEVNRTPVHSVADAQTQAQKTTGGPLLLLLKRGDASRFAALEQK